MLRLTESPETLFIVRTVGFIMSGLVVALLVWLAWREPGKRKQWVDWLPPFVLLAASNGLGAWGSFRLLVEVTGSEGLPLYFSASELLETTGLAGLVWVILRRPWGGWAVLSWGPPAVELGFIIYRGAPGDYPASAVHGSAAAVATMFGFMGALLRVRAELRYAGLGLCLISLGHISMVLSEMGSPENLYWAVASTLQLLGLTGLALSVERRSDDLFVQVFTRLNLTFIFLAGVLMALASQAERSKRMEFAGRQVEELAEFLRGHVMYYLSEGEPAQDILASPVILRQIVSGFGHYADLRMVRVQVLGEELELSIDEGGVVTQRQRTVSENPSDSARASPRVVVAELPIFYEDEPVGRVLLEETRESVNQEMAQSILVIFFAFTSAVTVASLIIGVIVFEASEKLKRQVKQIEQSERGLMQAAKLASIGELVSGVAHELNNPLGVIVSRTGYLRELMRDTLSSPRDMAEDLEAIDRQAHRISRIVRDLLGFARPHPLELGSVDVRDLVDQALHLTGGRVRQASLQVRKDIPADLPRLKADRDRLQQVLVNLINNAVDAMPKGGKLEFTARRQDGQILLSVSDTGVGIAEEDLKRIFDPFFSKKQGKGTGLGLSISYGIVRDHGGRIWAESRSGEGATFFVLLPAEARDE